MDAPADKILLNPGPSPRGFHRLESFLRCPRLFAFKQGGHLARDESAATARGRLLHVGLAQHYARLWAKQTGHDPERFYTPEEGIRELVDREGGGLLRGAMDSAIACVKAYVLAYAREPATLRVMHVEEVFEATFHGHLITARVDLVAEINGRVYLIDHKGTARMESRAVRAYSVSGQLVLYRWLGSMLYGDRFGGVTLNYVQYEPTKFERPTLDPAPKMFVDFPRVVADTEDAIARLEAEGRAPDDWPAAMSEHVCMTRYGVCPAIERCRWGPTHSGSAS